MPDEIITTPEIKDRAAARRIVPAAVAERAEVARQVALAWALASDQNLIELLAYRRALARSRGGGSAAVLAVDRRKAVDALQTLTKGAAGA